MVRLKSDRAIGRIVSHLDSVQDEVYQEAKWRGTKASAILRSHYRTGRSSIEVTRGRVDSYICLTDESVASAMAIEFGHTWRGKRVEGIYAITKAAGLA